MSLPEPGGADLLFRWDDLPPITEGLNGTGGEIRKELEDFVVEEIPAYLPSGEGQHLYVWVEKRGLTTQELVSAFQRAGVLERDIGVAGLKDKYAVTRQWLSLPARHRYALDAVESSPGITVLDVSRHRNKLGVGHLRGNRFDVRVRAPREGGLGSAQAVLDRLQESGVPNYFGPQRFGRFGSNAVDGLKVARGQFVPGGFRLKRFFLSALQSLVFNRLLALRIELGLFSEAVAGDWAKKHDTGGMFQVTEEAREMERARRLEISAALPLYGKKVKVSDGTAGELEAKVLGALELRWSDFRSRSGSRRTCRVLLEDVRLEAAEDGYRVLFTLPKGSFATNVLRELLKTDLDE